jgi:hypothetical protein
METETENENIYSIRSILKKHKKNVKKSLHFGKSVVSLIQGKTQTKTKT